VSSHDWLLKRYRKEKERLYLKTVRGRVSASDQVRPPISKAARTKTCPFAIFRGILVYAIDRYLKHGEYVFIYYCCVTSSVTSSNAVVCVVLHLPHLSQRDDVGVHKQLMQCHFAHTRVQCS
jgi:hypothetical protein